VLGRLLQAVAPRRRPTDDSPAGGMAWSGLYPDRGGSGVDQPSYRPTTTIAAATSSQLLAAANPARRSALIVNDSASAALYVSAGPVASTVAYLAKLGPGATFVTEEPGVIVGALAGVWDAAVGAARITETY